MTCERSLLLLENVISKKCLMYIFCDIILLCIYIIMELLMHYLIFVIYVQCSVVQYFMHVVT